ncbi:hypothetical protein CALCODRAFT_487342 [Calocera cornea HHB12733]|uniref:Uncharacterized protein n=1 Tax=Calocera cornea HHB12733 TaxID=1353952 RepID=A0A165D6Z0_9BASI|nr:hypothetical protein CALCODRAFT_488772 [Calocera cornea HHB12733]KZT52193.1 hypothetical protein CALCODRAFT_487342 [Calocera cornea HHB12733]
MSSDGGRKRKRPTDTASRSNAGASGSGSGRRAWEPPNRTKHNNDEEVEIEFAGARSARDIAEQKERRREEEKRRLRQCQVIDLTLPPEVIDLCKTSDDDDVPASGPKRPPPSPMVNKDSPMSMAALALVSARQTPVLPDSQEASLVLPERGTDVLGLAALRSSVLPDSQESSPTGALRVIGLALKPGDLTGQRELPGTPVPPPLCKYAR